MKFRPGWYILTEWPCWYICLCYFLIIYFIDVSYYFYFSTSHNCSIPMILYLLLKLFKYFWLMCTFLYWSLCYLFQPTCFEHLRALAIHLPNICDSCPLQQCTNVFISEIKIEEDKTFGTHRPETFVPSFLYMMSRTTREQTSSKKV